MRATPQTSMAGVSRSGLLFWRAHATSGAAKRTVHGGSSSAFSSQTEP